MKESPSDPGYGRTNWRRFAVSIGVPLAVAAGLVVALEQGALAASFQISGQDFKLSATKLDGTGFTQYASGMPSATNSDGGGSKAEAMSGIQEAWIQKLCQTVYAPVPIPVVMRIDAGDSDNKDNQVYAKDLLIGMSDLQGDASFSGIQIGVNDTSLSKDGRAPDSHGKTGGFGQQADSVTITGLKQTAQYTEASTFNLKGMRLHLYVGNGATDHECF